MLTKSNYHEWSLLMKVKLQVRQLWKAVHVGGVNYSDDRRALEALFTAVPLDVTATIADKSTASACAAPRCNSSEESGKVSPFSPVSKSRTSPCG
jgi:hypothetical protein